MHGCKSTYRMVVMEVNGYTIKPGRTSKQRTSKGRTSGGRTLEKLTFLGRTSPGQTSPRRKPTRTPLGRMVSTR